jgi:DNA repair protein RecO (recombination protein O)
MSSATYLTNGIVLKRRDYREYDRLITIFTEEYGKIEAVARGVRKIVSKLAGHLEPLSYASFMLARGRTFDVLATSIKLSSFRIPQTNVLAFALSSYFFEAVDRLTRQNQPDRTLFRLLVKFLHVLEATVEEGSHATDFQRMLVTEYFLYQLLRQLGYAPVLDRCAVGNESLSAEPVYLSPKHGGLVCAEHRKSESFVAPLSRQSVEVLRLMADQELAAVRLMNRDDVSLRQIGNAMNILLIYHLGEPLQSQAFLTSVLQ